jgi:hypothetical protein
MAQRIHKLPSERLKRDICANNEVMFKVTKTMRIHFCSLRIVKSDLDEVP